MSSLDCSASNRRCNVYCAIVFYSLRLASDSRCQAIFVIAALGRQQGAVHAEDRVGRASVLRAGREVWARRDGRRARADDRGRTQELVNQ